MAIQASSDYSVSAMLNEQSPATAAQLASDHPISPFAMRLKEEWARRMHHNPRYSLRAFARFLHVEPSFLSKILHGKRAVTESTLRRFGEKIGLTAEELPQYRETLDAARSRRMRELQATLQDSRRSPFPN